jgi:hypothetical protein
MLQQLDLSQRSLGQDLLAEDIGDLLDGDALVRRVVGRSAGRKCQLHPSPTAKSVDIPDDAVGTLAQLLGHIVPLVDNELLVEDLEDFAALQVRHGG